MPKETQRSRSLTDWRLIALICIAMSVFTGVVAPLLPTGGPMRLFLLSASFHFGLAGLISAILYALYIIAGLTK